MITLARRIRRRLPRLAVESLRVPPAWVGYRWWKREGVREYVARAGGDASLRVVHEDDVARNPLPLNVTSPDDLPDDRGWWGFSFRDVPTRHSGETFIATLPDMRVVQYTLPATHRWAGDYHVGFMGRDQRSVELREVRFRELHGLALRSGRERLRLEHATWIAERVYHNHSHWLTAHLPKLELLRAEGLLDDLVLPARRTPAMDASLAMLGIDPARHRSVEEDVVIEADRLTIVGSDRFRPELLQAARAALARPDSSRRRRLYISRKRANRRRLLNEEQVWMMLERAGFERVLMEDLSFPEQVRLMGEAGVVVAPHGAGLTNMLFCAPGTHVVEIADLSFPNPNFYALACGLELRYWLIRARTEGDGHPLERDMSCDVAELAGVVEGIVGG